MGGSNDLGDVRHTALEGCDDVIGWDRQNARLLDRVIESEKERNAQAINMNTARIVLALCPPQHRRVGDLEAP